MVEIAMLILSVVTAIAMILLWRETRRHRKDFTGEM